MSDTGAISVIAYNFTSKLASTLYQRSGGGYCQVRAGDVDNDGYSDVLVYTGSSVMRYIQSSGSWSGVTLGISFPYQQSTITLSAPHFPPSGEKPLLNVVVTDYSSVYSSATYYYAYG